MKETHKPIEEGVKTGKIDWCEARYRQAWKLAQKNWNRTKIAEPGSHEMIDWGHWLHCEHCGYHADRDYAASLNIARLGLTWLAHYQATHRSHWYAVTDSSVHPTSYTGVGSAFLLPPTTPLSSPTDVGTIFLAGWTGSVCFSSSYTRRSIFLISQASTRKSLLRLLTDSAHKFTHVAKSSNGNEVPTHYKSRLTPRFRKTLALPHDVQKAAQEAYALWNRDPFYSSLHFKHLKKGVWSVRITS